MTFRRFLIFIFLAIPAVAQPPAKKSLATDKSFDSLLNSVYVSYFGVRSIMSDELWANLHARAVQIERQSPGNKRPDVLIHFINGEVARNSNQFPIAEEEFKQAMKMGTGDDALPQFGLAETKLDEGGDAGWVSFANAEIPKQIPPEFQHLAYERIGELYEKANRLTDAIKAYEAAVDKQPKWAAGQVKLAVTMLNLNQPKAALPHIRLAVILDPKDAYSDEVLGRAYSQMSDSRAAIKAFRKAVLIDPGNAYYYARLGLEYQTAGLSVAAQQSLLTARQLSQNDSGHAELLKTIDDALGRLNASYSTANVTEPIQLTGGQGRAVGFAQLEGALIVADDGQFLGKITWSSVDSKSIMNEVGQYGSEVSQYSIRNSVGKYGGEVSRLSPFNSISSTPPRIFRGQEFVGYLTTNESKNPRVDPRALRGWLAAQN